MSDESGSPASLSHRAALDFQALIDDRTRQFTGRAWVFDRVNAWLADPAGARTFLLTGGPGTGKTAIAARLALASQGTPIAGCGALAPGFLRYHHFCQAGLDSTLAPMRFVQALSEALANGLPDFQAALQQRASALVSITANRVEPGGQMIGIKANIVRIEVRGDDVRLLFDEAVRLHCHRSAIGAATRASSSSIRWTKR